MKVSEVFHGLNEMPRPIGKPCDEVVGLAAVGIEIELENMQLSSIPEGARNYWNLIEDHSLRSTDGQSVEMVIDGTVSGESIVEALRLAYEAIAPYNVSSRTALHVHLNVADLKVTQVQDLLVLYVTLEEFFDSVGGGIRAFNNFSLGTKYSAGLLRLLGEFYHESPENTRRLLQRQGVGTQYRYAGVNLASLLTLGSLEFRNRCTPVEMRDALLWVNLILSLREYVVAFDGERIPFKALFEMMSGDVVRSMIGEVFHHPSVKEQVKKHIDNVDFYGSMRRAQSVLLYKDAVEINGNILNSLGA